MSRLCKGLRWREPIPGWRGSGLKQGFVLLGVFVAVIWVLTGVDFVMDNRLAEYGIVPRTVDGLWGIPLAPFLHAGFGHALSNTVPLLMLGGLVAARGWQTLLGVTLFVVLLGGAGVWLVARGGSHVAPAASCSGTSATWSADRLLAVVVIVVWRAVRRAAAVMGGLTGLIAGVIAARFGSRPVRRTRGQSLGWTGHEGARR